MSSWLSATARSSRCSPSDGTFTRQRVPYRMKVRSEVHSPSCSSDASALYAPPDAGTSTALSTIVPLVEASADRAYVNSVPSLSCTPVQTHCTSGMPNPPPAPLPLAAPGAPPDAGSVGAVSSLWTSAGAVGTVCPAPPLACSAFPPNSWSYQPSPDTCTGAGGAAPELIVHEEASTPATGPARRLAVAPDGPLLRSPVTASVDADAGADGGDGAVQGGVTVPATAMRVIE
mmetsp:Transcript_3395/g.11399  ORF Transcript_3395/g.11399 Transcript_3395/m.11399 type:complete len:231 (-) Transcript_3395:2566-3258(-)|eukprot:scaffold8847_cov112-Isochrysis_galbana.AAC.8